MLRVDTVMSASQGGPYYNSLYFNGTTQTEATNAAGAVSDFWQAVASAVVTSITFTIDPTVVIVNSSTGLATGSFTVNPGSPVQGISTDQVLPYVSQGLVQLRTGVYHNGRELRGRIFIPGPPETGNDGGKPTSSWRADVQGGVDALVGDADSTLIVYSPTHQDFATVTAGSVWTQWASLRSRRD